MSSSSRATSQICAPREAPLCSAIVLSPFASAPLQAAAVQQQTQCNSYTPPRKTFPLPFYRGSPLALPGLAATATLHTSLHCMPGKRHIAYVEAWLDLPFQVVLLAFNRLQSVSPLKEWCYNRNHPSRDRAQGSRGYVLGSLFPTRPHFTQCQISDVAAQQHTL